MGRITERLLQRQSVSTTLFLYGDPQERKKLEETIVDGINFVTLTGNECHITMPLNEGLENSVLEGQVHVLEGFISLVAGDNIGVKWAFASKTDAENSVYNWTKLMLLPKKD